MEKIQVLLKEYFNITPNSLGTADQIMSNF